MFRLGDIEGAVQPLIDMLLQFVCRDNIIGFLNTYKLVAQTYVKLNRKTEGLNVYI